MSPLDPFTEHTADWPSSLPAAPVSRPSSHSSVPPASATIPRPELAGSRRCLPGSISIYVIDSDGYRRAIPNSLTYNRLFRGWQGVVDDPFLERLPQHPALSTSVMLVRGDLSTMLYILDH